MRERRSDGTFGRDPSTGKSAGATGRPTAFKPGQSGNPAGRRRGSKNKVKAELAALLETLPGYATGALPPEDDLECLQWIKRHPRASLELINDAAKARAKFFHRTLSDVKTEVVDVEAQNRRILEGRRRVAEDKARRDAEEKQRQGQSEPKDDNTK